MRFVFFLIIGFLIPFVSFAQFAFQNAVTFKLNPTYPQPFSTITVSIESFSVDLDTSKMVWYVDGKEKSAGLGIKNITFKTGDSNKNHSIDVLVTNKEGQSELFNKIITPRNLDLIWQANTTVPPFYQGKALLGFESAFKVTAVLPGHESSGIRYVWKLNGALVQNQSGYGKNTFYFNSKTIKMAHTVSVEANLPNGEVVSNSLTLAETDPRVLFYEVKPLLGIDYSSSVPEEYFLTGDELRLRAEPFFFRKNNLFNFSWWGNSKLLEIKTQEASFTKGDNEGGKMTAKVRIENPNYLLQSAQYETYINY